ncbi:MAG TPA: serine/threonine-protein kinase [Methylomirabilota bacterium]|nr:serine/threonine-protein kinase [Methylomirabilota bacterium]
MQVGRYEILEIIGTGAHGRVARAHDPMIGRLVAVKLFPKELAAGEARQRFLKEARVVGQLSHPAIITLHDMGIDEATQTPYLVMEFLEGQPLDRILDKGSIPFPKACAWAGEVASALGVAHRKGVIHGDVKPANMLITDDGRVKLMDFGMARLASHDTHATPLAGTPAYWCPEQIMGKPQDSRSDLFSLGIVLYEMVTGKRPFDAESLQGICGKVLSSTPLPPSHANSSVPAAFDDIVARCLAKDPSLRHASAEAMAQELYPLARRTPAAAVAVQPANGNGNGHGLRDRAVRLLRSA